DAIPAADTFAQTLLPGAQHVVSYHVLVRGSCWATLHDAAAVRLDAGDILVVPHGDAYAMGSAPGMHGAASAEAVAAFFHQMATGSAPAVVIEGGGGPARTDLVCGFLACDVRPYNPVLAALPRLLRLPKAASHDHLAYLIELALAESHDQRPGARCVLLRLSEVLFVELIRWHLAGLAPGQAGWLAGLRDPGVGRALAALHDRPAEAWTLQRLAREAGVPRPTLAARFARLVGVPPMRYLARWRMQLAARLLSDGTATIGEIAGRVGYESEAAFSRSFKRTAGRAPATWRRQT